MLKVNIKVLYDNVLIQPIVEEKQGSIVIPPSSEKKPTKGKVVVVGEGTRGSDGACIPLKVKVGDIVFYRQWGGSELEHNDEKFIVMKESEILAVIIE